LNEQWRNVDADAHDAKAEAIQHAIDALTGLEGALDTVEALQVAGAKHLLERAAARHAEAAKLTRVP
jgi:peptide deformylase